MTCCVILPTSRSQRLFYRVTAIRFVYAESRVHGYGFSGVPELCSTINHSVRPMFQSSGVRSPKKHDFFVAYFETFICHSRNNDANPYNRVISRPSAGPTVLGGGASGAPANRKTEFQHHKNKNLIYVNCVY